MANTEGTDGKGRTRGRVPVLAERVKTTLLLDLDTVDWGKHQPGGLSEIIRRLLRQEMEQEMKTEQDAESAGKKENTR